MTDLDSEQPVEDEHTLFIVEAEDLDESNPYQVTMLEHPPDSPQATAVEEAMRQLVETAEEETGERHRLVTEVDTPEITKANYEMHTELLESEELATDGGRDIDYDEPPEIPDPPMYPEWEGVETWSKANLRYPVPGGWEIADHGKFHTTWEHEDGTELTRSSKRTPGQKDTFAFSVDGEEIHSVDAGPERAKMREETVWLLQFYDENGIESVEEFEVEVRKERNQSLDEFATDGGVDQSEAALDREERIEQFGERRVDHTEWWAEESGRVDEVVLEILDAIDDRDDVQLAKRGTSVSRTGEHDASFKLRIAGEPWEYHGRGDERTVYCCGGCDRLYENPAGDRTERCPRCGTEVDYDGTEVRTVVF